MRSRYYWLIGGLIVLLARHASAEDARLIIDMAIHAAGGREALRKYQGPVFREQRGKTFAGSGPFEITLKVTEWLPDKMRTEQVTLRQGIKVPAVQGLNATRGWITVESREPPARLPMYKATEMDATTIEATRNRLYMHWVATLLPLDEAAFQLATVDDIAIDSRPAIGVSVSHPDRPQVELYFDKETFLMVKLARVANGRVIAEFYFDHAELEGLVYPTRTVVHKDGKKVLEIETTEFKFIDPPADDFFDEL